MIKRILAIFLAAIFIVGCLAGCSSKDAEQVSTEQPTTTTPATEEPEAEVKDHMTVALHYFGTGLDPAESWNGWTLSRTDVAETLVKLDENMNLVGVLADSWENIDETTWKLHIREGVTFHNGKKMTPDDVKASMDRTMSLLDRAATVSPIDTVTVDGQSVIVTTTEPFGAFIGSLTDPIFSIIDTNTDLENYSTSVIGTGPYKIDSYKLDEQIETSAYDNYWGGAPALKTVTYKLITNADARALAVQSGDVDVAQGLAPASLDQFTDTEKYTISLVPSLRTELVWMNLKDEVLSDVAVRQAIAYCINRQDVADLLSATVATGAFPDCLPFGNEKLNAYTYDIEKAKQLLADAGYTDSNNNGILEANGKDIELEMICSSDTAKMTEAQYIQSCFEAIGLKLNIKSADNFLDAMAANPDFDLTLGNILTGTTGDPQYFLSMYFTKGASENYGGYYNSELEALVASLSTEMDTQKRYEIAAQAQQTILDDCPYLFLCYTNNNMVMSSSVANCTAQPIDYYVMTESISFK